MVTNILIIVLSSLFTLGWQYSSMYEPENPTPENPFGDKKPTDREIAWWFRYYLGRFIYLYIPNIRSICKPLFMCIVCMGGFYSFWAFVLYHYIKHTPISIELALNAILVTVATSGLNRIIRTNL